jgi:hypothetical protein
MSPPHLGAEKVRLLQEICETAGQSPSSSALNAESSALKRDGSYTSMETPTAVVKGHS